MENEVKKSNKGLYAIITILCVAVLGLGGFIVYDKFIKEDKETKNKKSTTTCNCTKDVVEETTSDSQEKTSTCFDLSKFDSSKAINNYGDGYEYYKWDDDQYITTGGVSVSAAVRRHNDPSDVNGNRIIDVDINWDECKKTSCIAYSFSATGRGRYQIEFSKDIKQIMIAVPDVGQSPRVLFVLMEDGTVEYVPIIEDFEKANSTDIQLKSHGPIENVKDVVYLSTLVGYNTKGTGATAEAYGIKEDGSFYFLFKAISYYNH